MTYVPKPGDRIRQTIVREGVVQPEGRLAVTDDGGRFSVDPDAYSSSGTVTNELVEPHYPVGSLWLVEGRQLVERTADSRWKCLPEGCMHSDRYPVRFLTRVYREGEQS